MRSADAPKQTCIRGGRIPGRDLETCAQADSEIPLEMETAGCHSSVVIDGNGVQCTGEHDCNACACRFPESFNPARSSRFVLTVKRCFVKRPSGSELETTIVAKTGSPSRHPLPQSGKRGEGLVNIASVLDLLAQAQRRRHNQTLLSTLRHLGAAGLFALAIIDSSPVPTFAGPDILTAILAASHKPLWYEYAASATAGSVLGAYITFRIARGAGAAYLDRKFKKGKMSKFLKLFRKWGTGTLVASTAIPLPTPTSMFFAAAGVSDYPRGRFLTIVALSRGVRYFGIAFIAGHYGRHVLRVLRHPLQHWGWLLLLLGVTGGLIVGGIIASHRLESIPPENRASARAAN